MFSTGMLQFEHNRMRGLLKWLHTRNLLLPSSWKTYFLAVSYRFNEFFWSTGNDLLWAGIISVFFWRGSSMNIPRVSKNQNFLGDSDSAFFYARRTLQLVQLGFHLIWNLTSLHIFTFKQWRWHDTSFSLPQQLASLPPWTCRAPSGSPIPWKIGQLAGGLKAYLIHRSKFFADMYS